MDPVMRVGVILTSLQELVNNDGIHFYKEASGCILLPKGDHRISIEYFYRNVRVQRW